MVNTAIVLHDADKYCDGCHTFLRLLLVIGSGAFRMARQHDGGSGERRDFQWELAAMGQ